jgi:hypothetical protein
VLHFFAVFLVDSGLAAMALGLVSCVKPLRLLRIRSRRQGLAMFGIGPAVVIAGMLIPAPLERVAHARSDLDRAMPAWQFRERHHLHVNASPEAVYRAIRDVTADDILLFRTLTWIRSPHLTQPDGESILQPPAEPTPILDVALRSGFLQLSERPGREVVVGAIVAGRANSLRGARTSENFIRLDAPGFAKATMNFLVEPNPAGGTDVETETRVYGTDAGATRRFAAYWRVIYPGSALIRVMWLRAIRQRAEAG